MRRAAARDEFTNIEIFELKVIKQLLDAGIKLESVREVFNYLRSHVDTEIAAAHIVISGKAVVLCQGDQLVDVVRNGQGVLNVLPLANIKSDVDAMIVSLAGRNTVTKAQPSSIASQASAQTVAL